MVLSWLNVLLLLVALPVGLIYASRFRSVAIAAPQLPAPTSAVKPLLLSVSVIIPAYNEASNIYDCVSAVLDSTTATPEHLQVWVVDDQSTDHTLAIAQTLQAERMDPRFQILKGQPRPADQRWIGKNWACAQAVEKATGDYVLFLDADVRLQPGAIETAIAVMQEQAIDLLTCWPALICGCLTEWLAQPLIVSLLMTAMPFDQVNDPKSDTIFAVGPFMLFRRAAYDLIGGHRAVAEQVVEDVELGRRIKDCGLKLYYALGHELATLRMYPTGAALWEGWTKNWHLGCQRNIGLTLYSALIVFSVFALPWVGLVLLLAKAIAVGINSVDGLAIGLALVCLLNQYRICQEVQRTSATPLRSPWSMGAGGLLVAAIFIASLIKTETGWGWTWRGRSLRVKNKE